MNQTLSQPFSNDREVARKTDWVSLFVAFLVLVWIVGVSLAVQFVAAVASALPYEILQRGDLSTPQIMFGAALLEVAALLIPLIPLALWWRAPRYRAAFRAWLAVTLF
ncbi:MAG TPA: hypothetical protein VFD70_02575, partial [Anaerolineae bacterium]|nr:hypothetical protein [Anaerolineae bacterium]